MNKQTNKQTVEVHEQPQCANGMRIELCNVMNKNNLKIITDGPTQQHRSSQRLM
jgi:hypothetical protein